MTRKLATTLVLVAALVMSTFSVFSSTRPAQAASNSPNALWPIDGLAPNPDTDNAILTWDEELLQAIRLHPGLTGPTVTSRALAVLHTATYDAWAAYDATAVPTMANGNLRQSPDQRTPDNKKEAISYAAFRVLKYLFPDDPYKFINTANAAGKKADFIGQMGAYHYATDGSTPTIPAQIGDRAAAAVIAYRANDGANQAAGYADTTGYQPTREYNQSTEPWRWQPLCVLTLAGVQAKAAYPPPPGTDCTPSTTQTLYTVQKPLTPQWKNVKAFALDAPNQFKPPGPPKLANGQYDPADIKTALADTSNLTDTKKMMAEYWADGPNSEFPPGHWALIAQALSRRRGHSIDTDAKMFFVLGNAVLDAGISAWSAKYQLDDPATATVVEPTWDFWRPIMAIRTYYQGQMINSWKGPGKGYGLVPAERWLPYQALNVVTPGFPEYTSGHSTFSGAARVAILAFTGSDYFAAKVTIPKGSSTIEPVTTPAKDVVLSWRDMLDASEQAGMSRRYGGIHFYSGDKHGRANGASVGYWDYDKATKYFSGDTSIQIPLPTP